MKTSDVSYINTLQDTEERLLGVVDKKKWVKESVKSKLKNTKLSRNLRYSDEFKSTNSRDKSR